jgi:hypothetical protein
MFPPPELGRVLRRCRLVGAGSWLEFGVGQDPALSINNGIQQ